MLLRLIMFPMRSCVTLLVEKASWHGYVYVNGYVFGYVYLYEYQSDSYEYDMLWYSIAWYSIV